MVDATLALAVIGGTAVLGYATEWVFEKTRVPDAIWLILFGAIVAMLGALPSSGMLAFAPVLAAIAIVVMSFEFGLRTDFRAFVHGLPRASLLAVVGVVLTTFGTALVAYAALGLDLVHALLLGVILSSVSSAPIDRLLHKMRVKEDFREFLKFEALLSDTIAFIVAILIINFYTVGAVANPVQAIVGSIVAGIIVGLAIGVVRLLGENEMKGKAYNYILTLGFAFIAYVATEWLGGVGVLGVIAYGLLLGNAKRLPKFAGSMREYVPSSFLKKFFSEISLFLRAFFFVMLGTLAVGAFNGTWWWGLVMLAVIILVRIPAVELSMLGRSVSRYESWMLKGVIPRDLSTIVLVLLAAASGIAGAESWLGVVFVVVLGSIVYTTAATVLVKDESAAPRKLKPVSYEKLPQRKLWKKYSEQ